MGGGGSLDPGKALPPAPPLKLRSERGSFSNSPPLPATGLARRDSAGAVKDLGPLPQGILPQSFLSDQISARPPSLNLPPHLCSRNF